MKRLFWLLSGCLLVLFSSACSKKYQFVQGYFDRPGFINMVAWKKKVDENYRPLPAYIDSLKQVDSFSVKMFVGTWCHDSKREVPRFFALQPHMPVQKVEIITLDTTKRDEKGMAAQYQIRFTPTFVFERNGQELGRYIEKPSPKRTRMEQNIYWITSGKRK